MRISKLSIWFSITFLITYGALAIYVSDLQLGERIGSGIFYLKGYYETTEIIDGQTKRFTVTDSGPGMFIIPLLVSSVVTLGAWVVSQSRKRV